MLDKFCGGEAVSRLALSAALLHELLVFKAACTPIHWEAGQWYPDILISPSYIPNYRRLLALAPSRPVGPQNIKKWVQTKNVLKWDNNKAVNRFVQRQSLKTLGLIDLEITICFYSKIFCNFLLKSILKVCRAEEEKPISENAPWHFKFKTS